MGVYPAAIDPHRFSPKLEARLLLHGRDQSTLCLKIMRSELALFQKTGLPDDHAQVREGIGVGSLECAMRH
ncbi:MAG: hypothetical protein ACI87O_001707 [Planctomycetota bacterium]|jgi:hypothetical protein